MRGGSKARSCNMRHHRAQRVGEWHLRSATTLHPVDGQPAKLNACVGNKQQPAVREKSRPGKVSVAERSRPGEAVGNLLGEASGADVGSVIPPLDSSEITSAKQALGCLYSRGTLARSPRPPRVQQGGAPDPAYT